jgi:hypothetical protein
MISYTSTDVKKSEVYQFMFNVNPAEDGARRRGQ